VKHRPRRNYTYKSLHEERELGVYWYSGLWHIVRPVLVALASLTVVIGLLSMLWQKLDQTYLSPPGGEESKTFVVESGQSLTRVSRNLEEAGLIRSKTVFKYYCDFSGLGQKIQTGTYELSGTMTLREIADQLTRGDGNPTVRNITMIPGWTLEEFADRLVQDGILKERETFLSLCRDGTAFRDYYYIADILDSGKARNRKYVLEGYLAANTYEVYVTATEDEIIRKLLSQTERAFPASDQDEANDQGFTMDEILTMASMIEKEAKTADFTKVSAVFHNRLQKGMKLESDVTIHYVTGVRRMHLRTEDLNTDSPYNTYRYSGLPAGPICAPSPEAIQAALNPDPVYRAEGYLYFCAKNPESGELYFSKTLDEHERAVAEYAPLWEEYDKKRGLT